MEIEKGKTKSHLDQCRKQHERAKDWGEASDQREWEKEEELSKMQWQVPPSCWGQQQHNKEEKKIKNPEKPGWIL